MSDILPNKDTQKFLFVVNWRTDSSCPGTLYELNFNSDRETDK